MAAANRGECCKTVSLPELSEWPLVDGVLLQTGLVSALNVMPQCSKYAKACVGSRITQAPEGSPACSLLCHSMEMYAFVSTYVSPSVPLVAVLKDMRAGLVEHQTPGHESGKL